MLDRSVAPATHEIEHLSIPYPQKIVLDNGIPLYILDFPGHEILKIEAVYKVGRPQEHKKLVARATARLMREGTARHSGTEIAEHIDFYGGSLNIPNSLENSTFSLFSLKKYAPQLIPLFAEILQEPIFPQQELDTFVRTALAELAVELEKVDVMAYRKVTELIFGSDHPYGYNSVPADYQSLTRSDLEAHYQQWLTPNHCQLFVTGHINQDIIDLLNQYLGQWKRPTEATKSTITSFSNWQVAAGKPQKAHLTQANSLQTAISIGRRAFHRKHPDFQGLFILNTILGGYFGSRLMTNIREKKGFTYNIYSTVDAMTHDGCMYIATEVNSDKSAATLRAIFSEMKKLREKPIEAGELNMVRNYLLGMLLNGLDGPMNVSDVVRGLIVEEMEWAHYDQLVHTIRTISAEDLQVLAQKYLQTEDFWVVTVGGSTK
jgi:zinc protease